MAQERKKRRIVLASVLKPVDDTRMFEKMGVSLAQKGGYEVIILGYPSASIPVHEGIQFISLSPFKRLSLSRLAARWIAFWKLLKLKPSLLIFTTHELLIPAVVLKVLMNVKIIYDVRENYYRNILHSGSFPLLIRWPLAFIVRFKEKLFAPAVDHFFLAELGYEKEFRFHRGGWTVIENKAVHVPSFERMKDPNKTRLLFSGTLAESTGVFRAITMAKELYRLDSGVSLTIAGYAALKNVRDQIQQEVKKNSWITLIGVDQLVPHEKIMECIQQSDFGIIAYPLSDHTNNSKPTKLFEYFNTQLPIIIEQVWPWISEYDVFQPFLICDLKKLNGPELIQKMKTQTFYPRVPEDVTWLSEVPKILQALEKL